MNSDHLKKLACSHWRLVPLSSSGLVLIDFFFQFCQPCEIIRDFLQVSQDNLSGKNHAFVYMSGFRVQGPLLMISHYTLAKLLEIDLIPINVQVISDAFSFI